MLAFALQEEVRTIPESVAFFYEQRLGDSDAQWQRLREAVAHGHTVVLSVTTKATKSCGFDPSQCCMNIDQKRFMI